MPEIRKTTLFRYVLSSKWTWISIVAAVGFWLYALAIENTYRGQNIHPLAEAIVPNLFRYRFAYDLIMNIGTAILVSRIISIFIGYEENSTREDYFQAYLEQQRDFYDTRIKEVSQSSFRGVYQSRFPDGLINEVLEIGFNCKIIRESLSLDYKLRKPPNGILGTIVEATAEYQLRNISQEDLKNLPVFLEIPNPVNSEMKEHCQFIEYRKNYEAKDVQSSCEALVENLKTSTKPTVKIELDTIELRRNETVNIVLVYSMAKEVEDTELVRVGTPTTDLKVTIHNETGDQLWIDAKAIHRVELKDISPPNDRKVREYRSPEFFLPHQGFVWFWKKNLPGQVQPASLAEGHQEDQMQAAET